jgi:hypothetical protein
VTPSQWIHVATILLGGLATILAFLNDMQAAGVVAILITVTGTLGAYVGSLPASSPDPTTPAVKP